MSRITTIGLDTAKNIFHAMCCDARGKVVKKRMLKRGEVLAFFARQQPCLIGMEACGEPVNRIGRVVKTMQPRCNWWN